MLAKKKKNYIQMNKGKEADKSSGFVHPFVELRRDDTLSQAHQKPA